MTRRFPRVVEALRRRLSGGPDEYWVKGSELVHVPRSRIDEIPKLIGEYHDHLRGTEDLRAMLRNGSVR